MPINAGKDKIIFATKEDHDKPSSVVLEEDPEPEGRGLILANGEINWNCPCLGGMASGPCGVEFREAFSCFHYSQGEPKGSDCLDQFHIMQDCMTQYPALYPNEKEKPFDPEEINENPSAENLIESSSSSPNDQEKPKS